MRRRLGGAIAVAATGFLLGASPAMSAHHLVKVREVSPGSTANPGAEFVELQLSAAGENQLFSTTSIQLYGPTGAVTGSGSFEGDPANGANQRFVLSSTAAAGTLFMVAPDLTLPAADALDPSGGAACFESTTFPPRVDCVSWGNFTNPPAGSNTGSPESPAGIPDGNSIVRRTSAGCATLLDASDDVDDSATDFEPAATPLPQNNASTPTETACGGGGGTTPTVPANPLAPATAATPAPAPRKPKKCKKAKKRSAAAAAKKCKKK